MRIIAECEGRDDVCVDVAPDATVGALHDAACQALDVPAQDYCVTAGGESLVARHTSDTAVCDVDTLTENTRVAVELSAHGRRKAARAALFDLGYAVVSDDALAAAAAADKWDVARLMLATQTLDGGAVLGRFANDADRVRRLLDCGVAAGHGETLCAAVRAARDDVVVALVEHPAFNIITAVAPTTPSGRSIILDIVHGGSIIALRRVFDAARACGITEDVLIDQMEVTGSCPGLLMAAHKQRWDLVREMAARGGDVNIVDWILGTPAVAVAAKFGCSDSVADLIAAGADVNKSDKNMKPPLAFAAQGGHVRAVTLLLDAGAAVELPDFIGRTRIPVQPLHLAARDDHRDVVCALLARGANVNLHDSFGKTPYMYAYIKRHKAMMALLVEHGARLHEPDSMGRCHLCGGPCTEVSAAA